MKTNIIKLFIATALNILLITSCTNLNNFSSIPTEMASIPTLKTQETDLTTIISTPIDINPNTKEELKAIIKKKYDLSSDPKCNKDLINSNNAFSIEPSLDFSSSPVNPFDGTGNISQIADNYSHTKRAFIFCEDPNKCNDELLFYDSLTKETKEINWNTRVKSRPIGNISWIGNDILIVIEQTGISIARIAVINIEENKFELYWQNDNHCNIQ
jgi:hypothetical protein